MNENENTTQEETQANGTSKKRVTDTVEVYVPVFEDFDGAREDTRKYSALIKRPSQETDLKYRYDLQLPIPRTEEESKKYYNLSLSDLVAKGVRQHAYDENLSKVLLDSALASNRQMDSEDMVKEMKTVMEGALFYEPKEKAKGPSAAKELDQVKKSAGVSTTEELQKMVKFVAKMKAEAAARGETLDMD
jgi:hypothetical protein